MPDFPTLTVFLIAALSLNITPGPDMLYVITRSLGQNRTAGIISALGIGGGTIIHTIAVAAGLSALLFSVPIAFDAVKYIGALYLVYIGIKTLRQKKSFLQTQVKRAGMWQIFRQGVITNVFNPKVALFFIAFLPQFVDSSRGNTFWQIIILGFLFNVSGTTVNIGVAILSSIAGSLLKTNSAFGIFQRRLTGGIFIALGIRLALVENR